MNDYIGRNITLDLLIQDYQPLGVSLKLTASPVLLIVKALVHSEYTSFFELSSSRS